MKMNQIVFMAALLLFPVFVSLYAQERIVDNAGLLNSGEREHLSRLLAAVASAYNFDLVIVTENNIGNQRPMDYADNFFDNNGYGLGNDRDGCLFLQVVDSRDYWFSTSGRGITLLNTAAFNKLETDVLRFLRDNDSPGAYRAFIADWEQFLVLDAHGRHYSFFQQWHLVLTAVSWLAAFIIGCIIVQVWKSHMNTALIRTHAAEYMVPDSLAFTKQQDRFLYSTITKMKRETHSSPTGGGVHTGSSGRSHGGGGGKY